MTAEQMAFVAAQPENAKISYGRDSDGTTIVVAKLENDYCLSLYEDGWKMLSSPNGAVALVSQMPSTFDLTVAT